MLHRSIHMIERQMNRWPCIIEYIGYEPTNMCRSTADTLSQETMGWDALVTGHWSLVTQVVIKADISLRYRGTGPRIGGAPWLAWDYPNVYEVRNTHTESFNVRYRSY